MKKLILCIVICMLTFNVSVYANYTELSENIDEISVALTNSDDIEILVSNAAIIMAENNVLKELEDNGELAVMATLKASVDEALKYASYDDIEKARDYSMKFVDELKKAVAVLAGETNGCRFVDVKPGSWYYEAVEYTAEKGIFAGISDNSFAPNQEITRGMFLALMDRMYLDTDEKSPQAYSDVEDGKYYSSAINYAAANGILAFVNGNRFYPDKPITREELVTILMGCMSESGISISNVGSSAFDDNDSISEWARDAVSWAAEKKIVAGLGNGLFGPQDTATRAQVAQILYGVAKGQYE